MPRLTWLIVVCVGVSALASERSIKRLDGSRMTVGELEAVVSSLMQAAHVPGLGITVLNDRRVVYQKAFGERDRESRLPLTPDSVMTGASFTKVAVGFLALQLVDEGRLALDRPVHSYLPNDVPSDAAYQDLASDERYRRITARMLLSHTAGFPNLRVLNRGKVNINFEPGSRYAYSGEGIRLLQQVVEAITGASIRDVMRTRVFERLGMRRTSMVWEPSFESDFAYGYDEREERVRFIRRQIPDAAGSMQTTLADYSRFLEAIAQRKGLSQRTRTEMLTPQIRIRTRRQFPTLATDMTDANDAIRLSYGLGWGLFFARPGMAFFKEGHDDGWQHYSIVFDERRIGIVLMSNSSNAERIFPALLDRLIANTYTPIDWEGYVPFDRRPAAGN
jgi:CubicO group peptidase (beta-lactamase class C family)